MTPPPHTLSTKVHTHPAHLHTRDPASCVTLASYLDSLRLRAITDSVSSVSKALNTGLRRADDSGTLWKPSGRLPGGPWWRQAPSSVHGISQARIPGWVAISFSRRSPQTRGQTRVSRNGRWILSHLSHPVLTPKMLQF